MRTIQAKPQRIRYCQVSSNNHLEVHVDRAFAKKHNQSYALKGANVMRRCTERSTHDTVHQLLEGTVLSHKNHSTEQNQFATNVAVDNLIRYCLNYESASMDPWQFQRPRGDMKKVDGHFVLHLSQVVRS